MAESGAGRIKGRLEKYKKAPFSRSFFLTAGVRAGSHNQIEKQIDLS